MVKRKPGLGGAWHRYVFVCCAALLLLSLCAVCIQPLDEPAQTGVSDTQQIVEPDGEKYLLPYIEGRGVPRICVRHSFRHSEQADVFLHPPGKVFQPGESPSALRCAVWADGTVLWGDGARPPRYYQAAVPPETVTNLLESIDMDSYKTPNNARFSAGALRLIGTVITVVDRDNSLFLCSQIEDMKRVGRYLYSGGRELKEYPCSEYTFEQFCEIVPGDYSQFLRDYVRLREKLRAIVPSEGREVKLQDTVQWVIVINDGRPIDDQIEKYKTRKRSEAAGE